jgi:hypothetical protein
LDPFAQELLNRLKSSNAAEREAAHKQLDSIVGLLQSPEMLARLEESTADVDLKDFFAARISQMKAKEEERRITHLPLISLDVTDANMTQLAAALNDALGTPNKFTGINSGKRVFTLKAENQTFWEIFVALSQQQPLSIQSMGGSTMRLTPSGNPIRRYAVNGPVMAYVNNVSYQRNHRLQNPDAGDSWGTFPNNQAFLAINVMCLMDPRVHISGYTYPTLLSAVDDAGNTYMVPRGGNSSFTNAPVGSINHSFSIPAPDKLGKSLNLVCEIRIAAATSELTGALDDIENNLNKPVTVGTRTFRVLRFNPQGTSGNYALQLNVTDDSGGTSLVPGRTIPNSGLIPYTLRDSTGRAILNINAPGSGMFTLNVPVPGVTGPFKLEFHVPGKTNEIPLRFELKDVPLP